MDSDIWPAYVAGLFSFITALYAAGKARSAEAASKLNDHVRTKALEAVEQLSLSLGQALLATRALAAIIEAGGYGSSEDFIRTYHEMHGESVDHVIRNFFRTRVYWTDDMSRKLDSLVELLTHVQENAKHFREREQLIAASIADLVSYSRANLLRATLPLLVSENAA